VKNNKPRRSSRRKLENIKHWDHSVEPIQKANLETFPKLESQGFLNWTQSSDSLMNPNSKTLISN
jgi:hypothetical protein